MLRVLVFGLSLALATACAHSTGGVAASTIPLAPGAYRVLGDALGRDCVFHLFGFIPLTGGNTTHEAVRKALTRSGADALINVTADTYSQWWVVVTNTCTEVRGTAVSVAGTGQSVDSKACR